MKTLSACTALALAVLSHSTDVAADGNELLKACQNGIAAFESDGAQGSGYQTGYCVGVMNGVSSMTELLNGAITKEKQFCLPKTMTNIQGARVVVKYLTDHPNILHYPDGYAVLIAYQNTFPCNFKQE
ncbi:Rap1a/Tai family immunity protein [Pseudomonas wadenswilerensis]|uniref:Rap1a/Tai family immunity protein n=1 Tax=Pseudomonas wadenswilerensis TaxID=1785161 RepID=UPI003208D590